MEPFDPRQLPFLTRKMLAFDGQTTLTLIVRVIAHDTAPLEIRGFTKEGPFTFRIVPVGDSSVEEFILSIPDIPIMVSADIAIVADTTALAYVAISIGIASNRIALLTQGLVGNTFGVAWPVQLPYNDAQQNGAVVSVVGTNPIAGQNFSQTVPSNQQWELLAVSASLVASADVATRTARFEVFFPNNGEIVRASGVTQTAGQTIRYTWVAGGTNSAAAINGGVEVAAPAGIICPTGTIIDSGVTNLQAADNWGAPEFIIRRNYLIPAP